MSVAIDFDRARTALLMAAGVTTATALVLSRRSVRSALAHILQVRYYTRNIWFLNVSCRLFSGRGQSAPASAAASSDGIDKFLAFLSQ